jgi:uncharacterized protein (TIGR02145 family)
MTKISVNQYNIFKIRICTIILLFNGLFLISISFLSCKKEEEKVMMVSNDSISNISYTTAIAHATIINPGEGIEQHGHCWASSGEPTININENKTENGPASISGSFISTLTDLLPDTKYYVKAYIENSGTVIYGGYLLSFRTLGIENPVVSTGEVKNITASTANVSGNLEDLGPGAAEVIQHGHCWSSETITPVIENNSKTSLGSRDSTGIFESQLTSLSSNTLYYVRAYATNSAGTSYGNYISFTTLIQDPNINWEPGDDWTDTRDNQTYKTVKIGNKVWMAENLKATFYADSTPLADGTGVGDLTGQYSAKYWFAYNNDLGHKDYYGLLYTWTAVMNSAPGSDSNPSGVQGICPSGWHVPSDSEWKELEMYLGMSQAEADNTEWRGTDEGTKLKSTVGWNSGGNGSNTSGFTAIPAGFRYYDGNFGSLGIGAFFWNSTELHSYEANGRLLLYNYTNVYRDTDFKGCGFSVRCVKNSDN